MMIAHLPEATPMVLSQTKQTKHSNEPRRLGSVPGVAGAWMRIRFVKWRQNQPAPGQTHFLRRRAMRNPRLWCSVEEDRVNRVGIGDSCRSSPEIVAYEQRLGPNRSRSLWSYLRNVRSRGP